MHKAENLVFESRDRTARSLFKAKIQNFNIFQEINTKKLETSSDYKAFQLLESPGWKSPLSPGYHQFPSFSVQENPPALKLELEFSIFARSSCFQGAQMLHNRLWRESALNEFLVSHQYRKIFPAPYFLHCLCYGEDTTVIQRLFSMHLLFLTSKESCSNLLEVTNSLGTHSISQLSIAWVELTKSREVPPSLPSNSVFH